MKIIYNNIIPFDGFKAINLFGIVFARKRMNDIDINHESIHTALMKELGYILFYIWYIIEWFIRLFLKGNAYRNIKFELEAYKYQRDLNYLKNRKHYEWFKLDKRK